MESYCSLCTLDTIHKLFLVTRLIINKINKVQWVDFKLENVLVSLHFLKTMAPLFLRNGEFLGHSPMHICVDDHQCSIVTSNLIKHARNITRIRMESCIHGRRPVYPSRNRLFISSCRYCRSV